MFIDSQSRRLDKIVEDSGSYTELVKSAYILFLSNYLLIHKLFPQDMRLLFTGFRKVSLHVDAGVTHMMGDLQMMTPKCKSQFL